MDQTLSKLSKIPVLKKAKMLKPVRLQKPNDSDCFKYCRNCSELRDNVSVLEQNMTTLLKENNFLRQQLSLLDSNNDSISNTNSTKQSAICSLAEHGKNNISKNYHDPPCLYDDINVTQAFNVLPGHLFSNFDAALLCNEIDYTHCLSSRKVKFYGDAPYKYGDTLHEPCPVPNNSYLLEIAIVCSHIVPTLFIQ